MGVIITKKDRFYVDFTDIRMEFGAMGESRILAEGILRQNKKNTKSQPSMSHEKIIFSDRTTIVLWKDGTKTVVKAAEGEAFDPEKGVAIAFMKKALGNTNHHNKILRKDVRTALAEAWIRREKRCIRVKKKEMSKATMARPIDALINAFSKMSGSVKDLLGDNGNATESDI